jgi:hypothetical protein
MKGKNIKNIDVRRRSLIIISVIFALILYVAGLLSGFSFSKFTEKNIEEKTAKELGALMDYVKSLDSDLQSIQIQEMFVGSLNENDTCTFSEVYSSNINKNLNYFWSVLPARLEEYERNIKPTWEYLELKRQYTKLSLRAWIISKNNYDRCNSSIIPILYLYSKNCTGCIKQGEELDKLKQYMKENDKSLMVFTIDFDYDDSAIDLIKEYYKINRVPALIINNKLLQGRIFNESEMIVKLKKGEVLEK